MLKKTNPVPIRSQVCSVGNCQQVMSGSALRALPVRLASGVGSADKIESSTILSQHAANLTASHCPHDGYAGYSVIHPEDINTVGSMESWRLLLKQLSMLVGSDGSDAIFFHCIGQLGLQYPALSALSPKHSWPEQLAMVQNTLQQLPQASAAFARQSLWFRGSQLITKLLGLSLCRRLLHQVATMQSTYQHG